MCLLRGSDRVSFGGLKVCLLRGSDRVSFGGLDGISFEVFFKFSFAFYVFRTRYEQRRLRG